METTKQAGYRPILFIAITFGITWILAVFHAYQTWFSSDTIPGTIILIIANFFSSASPLVAAIILLRKSLFKGHNLTRFVFGAKPILLSYIIVAALFLFQFLTFFFFRFENNTISINAFIAAWCGQILLGGGMEEGGWRGYLQPAIEQKVHITITVIIAGLVWALWHLPYFFLPGTIHTGGNFGFYIVTTIATAYTLTAIYKLTGSVLICTLFHGWQNAIVMNIPTDMGSAGFLVMFAIQTIVSIILCMKPLGLQNNSNLA